MTHESYAVLNVHDQCNSICSTTLSHHDENVIAKEHG